MKEMADLDNHLDGLLEKTSRTFALSIPLLPEPTRRQVSIAYLLFRIADTFEDAELWSPEERKKALADFSELLATLSEAGRGARANAPAQAGHRDAATRFAQDSGVAANAQPRGSVPSISPLQMLERGGVSRGEAEPALGLRPRRPAIEPEALAAAWTAHPPCDHAGYLELLRETPAVLRDFSSLDPPAREIVSAHVRRSAAGMSSFVSRMAPDGNLVLEDLADLRRYCYAVAGIVGEMLTELFLLGGRLAAIETLLRRQAPLFGEGLQLVNIVKDSSSDARSGRRYVPEGVDRSEVFSLARADLGAAGEYVLELQRGGAPRGLVGFTALPVELAWASLDRIEKFGAGAKVSRPEVFLIAKRLERALDRNEPAIFSISCGER